MIRRSLVPSILGAVTLLASLAVAAPAPAYVNWPGYMLNKGHSSLNRAATTITPANAGALAPAWSHGFAPAASGFSASPVVYKGSVYIGANNGGFYQLKETTGAVVHKVSLGRELSCAGSTYGYGVEDTATVAPDPSRGRAPTVYVTGGNGKPNANGVDGNGGIYLWALDARTLKPVWKTDPVTVSTQRGAIGWASPVVSHGTISVGIASGCDSPEVRGGLAVFSQSRGALVGTYWAVPAGNEGGPIWSTPAASGSSTWAATGNATSGSAIGDSYSIVRLRGARKVDSWTIPGQTAAVDNDFGASPTLFTGLVGTKPTKMIGDCNKNGTFYALQSQSLSSGPVWTYQLAASGTDNLCNAGAVWDARAHELIMGSTLTPNGHPGSIQALSPDANAPRRVIWQTYLPCPVEGVPSEDGRGVLAVTTFSESEDQCSPGGTPSLYLYNAHATVPNGSGPPAPQLIKTIPLGASSFSQPAFADRYLFVAGESNGKLMALTPPLPTIRAQIKAQLVKQLAPAGQAAKIGALLKKGGFTFRFRTLTGGRLKIAWYLRASAQRGKPVLVAIGKARFAKARRVKFTIKLTRTGRRMLKAARSVRLIARGTYRPTSKPAVSAAKKFTLRR
jgi:hypothetical protein